MEKPKYLLAKESETGEIVDIHSNEPGDRYVYLETDETGSVKTKRYLSDEEGERLQKRSDARERTWYHEKDNPNTLILEKPREKKIVPLANKKAVKKKSQWARLKEAIFGEDVRSIPEFVIYDLLIPNAKRLFMDMVNSALGIAFFGDSNARKKRDDNRTHVSMSSVYDDRNSNYRSHMSRSSRSRLSDLVFDSKSDAEFVLEQLQDCIDSYGSVSVQDLYYIVGQDATYTDANYGWTNLGGASVVACSDGYTLSLPPTKAIV